MIWKIFDSNLVLVETDCGSHIQDPRPMSFRFALASGHVPIERGEIVFTSIGADGSRKKAACATENS
jgi:hypothetical protein